MSRARGIFNLSGNYDPLISAPLDARMVVGLKADLINPATWQRGSTKTPYVFNGLLTVVTKETDKNLNGLYLLLDATNYTVESSWYKIADIRDVESLNEKIDNVQPSGGGGSVTVDTRNKLPNLGNSGTTYFVKDENATYRWDDTDLKYYCVGRDYQEIKVINGGNAVEYV